MADSDDTYPAEAAKELIAPVLAGEADMVNGDRLSSTYATENKRRFHSFGNWLVCTLIRRLFHYDIADVMTGYRAFSWRFAKHCPVLSSGFEIETEMTIFALDKRMAIKEIPIAYRDRPKGSFSKLNTFADGFRIIRTIFTLLRNYRPLFFFGSIAPTNRAYPCCISPKRDSARGRCAHSWSVSGARSLGCHVTAMRLGSTSRISTISLFDASETVMIRSESFADVRTRSMNSDLLSGVVHGRRIGTRSWMVVTVFTPAIRMGRGAVRCRTSTFPTARISVNCRSSMWR
jgi:hypothetical protein